MSKIGFVHKCITIDSTPYGKALLICHQNKTAASNWLLMTDYVRLKSGKQFTIGSRSLWILTHSRLKIRRFEFLVQAMVLWYNDCLDKILCSWLLLIFTKKSLYSIIEATIKIIFKLFQAFLLKMSI